ncbi:unnamed protein product [Clavelina lepadiformis]|uniref:Secreted protein n=1 Tax=Clavelina lepadiformis TaxID=159417 RepID=A0ABP0FVX6_CLALP
MKTLNFEPAFCLAEISILCAMARAGLVSFNILRCPARSFYYHCDSAHVSPCDRNELLAMLSWLASIWAKKRTTRKQKKDKALNSAHQEKVINVSKRKRGITFMFLILVQNGVLKVSNCPK